MSAKYERRLALLTTIPNCPHCGCKMVVTKTNVSHGSYLSHAAILYKNSSGNESLHCYQCHRIAAKLKDIAALPFITRWKKRIDDAFGIFSYVKRMRLRIHNYIYFNIRGGIPKRLQK